MYERTRGLMILYHYDPGGLGHDKALNYCLQGYTLNTHTHTQSQYFMVNAHLCFGSVVAMIVVQWFQFQSDRNREGGQDGHFGDLTWVELLQSDSMYLVASSTVEVVHTALIVVIVYQFGQASPDTSVQFIVDIREVCHIIDEASRYSTSCFIS